MRMADPALRFARCFLRLRVYDVIVEYRTAKSNDNANVLSRWSMEDEVKSEPEDQNGVELDVETVVVIAKKKP